MSILACRKDQRDSKADSDCLIVVEMFLILVFGWTEVVDGHLYCYLDNLAVRGLKFSLSILNLDMHNWILIHFKQKVTKIFLK